MTDDTRDVGYGKPPKATQFKPGKSGNPKGRPKGSKSLKTLVRKIMDERVVLREGGKKLKISKREAIVRNQIHKAALGNDRATQRALDLDMRFADPDEQPIEGRPLTLDDLAVLEALRQRERSLTIKPDRSPKSESGPTGRQSVRGKKRTDKAVGQRSKSNKGKSDE